MDENGRNENDWKKEIADYHLEIIASRKNRAQRLYVIRPQVEFRKLAFFLIFRIFSGMPLFFFNIININA
jgi:hypothetical protein